jgi:hypothetical protein
LQNPHLRVILKEADHLGEVGAPGLLGGLNVDELADHLVVVAPGV